MQEQSHHAQYEKYVPPKEDGFYTVSMLLIIGTIRIPSQNLARAYPVMRQMIEASRREKGCIAYAYAEDILERGLIHVSEQWSDQESLERHFQSYHLAQWREAWPDLGVHGRDLWVYEVADPRRT